MKHPEIFLIENIGDAANRTNPGKGILEAEGHPVCVIQRGGVCFIHPLEANPELQR